MALEFCTTFGTRSIDQKSGEETGVFLVPRAPKGEGWTLKNTALDGVSVAWTWQREIEVPGDQTIDELLTQRQLDL